MTPPSSPCGSSCSPAASSLFRHGKISVFHLQLLVAKQSIMVRSHKIIDGSNASDRDRFGKRIDTKLHFKFCNKKGQIQ
jgi:hypothetical protein